MTIIANETYLRFQMPVLLMPADMHRILVHRLVSAHYTLDTLQNENKN